MPRRFADAALWATAAAPALGLTDSAIAAAFENYNDPIAASIQALLNKSNVWSGTATELSQLVNWHGMPKGLTQVLHRTVLENVPIESRRTEFERRLTLTRLLDASRLFRRSDASGAAATH